MFEESMSAISSIWASVNSWFTPTVLFVLLNVMIGTIAITSSLATNNKPTDHQENQSQAQQPHARPQLGRTPSMLQRLKSINLYSHRSQEPTTINYERPSAELESHLIASQEPLSQEYHRQQPPLTRSPSILQRLRSINLYNYLTPEQKTHESYAHLSATQPSYQEQGAAQDSDHEEEKSEQIREEEEETMEDVYRKLQSNNNVSRCKSDTKPASGEIPKKLAKKMKKSASAKSAFGHFEEDEVVESRRPATVREGKAKVTEVDDAEVDAKADDFINKFKHQLKLQRIDSIIRYKDMVSRGSGR
ncbi:hypothetical protein K2173_015758 [Erythroxylum novogranatense]|uniref:DUF4408 domain-containing protein n=1 Tax=Erythroxylum novogranatense TaxID=1862640 RepID=A0AAV8SEX8_9ROSI|nr:hypothetical protein K2173_015758 [Erythroxylum novogranatense]